MHDIIDNTTAIIEIRGDKSWKVLYYNQPEHLAMHQESA